MKQISGLHESGRYKAQRNNGKQAAAVSTPSITHPLRKTAAAWVNMKLCRDASAELFDQHHHSNQLLSADHIIT